MEKDFSKSRHNGYACSGEHIMLGVAMLDETVGPTPLAATHMKSYQNE